MAQKVGYYDDNVIFQEGPFVIVNPLGNGWRIECEGKGHYCPALPEACIYQLRRKRFGWDGKTFDLNRITEVCDWLNEQVRRGLIVLVDGVWIVKPSQREVV